MLKASSLSLKCQPSPPTNLFFFVGSRLGVVKPDVGREGGSDGNTVPSIEDQKRVRTWGENRLQILWYRYCVGRLKAVVRSTQIKVQKCKSSGNCTFKLFLF